MYNNIRPVAIYLPQFHPVPENDAWWGKGFTEWTNVTQAQPRFPGHYQPHIPSDMGFYDLRVPETREEQAALAAQYGIYGFCYYHYWFNGRRILERPFQEVFESGKPDFPFMLCWANENWTRAWDGSDEQILLQQNYSEEDDLNHIQALIPYFKDPRYIKVDGKPVFIVYKSPLLPNPKRTTDIWREEARKHGLELYICRMDRWNIENGKHILEQGGFDAAIEFQPLSQNTRDFFNYKNYQRQQIPKYKRAINRIKRHLYPEKKEIGISYAELVEFDKKRPLDQYKIYPGVCPSWDNTARRKDGALTFVGSTPQLFKEWVKSKLEKFTPYSKEENFLFINAWNEWAEGNHMEPCQKWGRKYLEAFKEALDDKL